MNFFLCFLLCTSAVHAKKSEGKASKKASKSKLSKAAQEEFKDKPIEPITDLKEEKLKTEKELEKSERATWVAHILRESPREKKVSGLQLVSQITPVFLVPYEKNFKPLVKLNLQYSRPGWDLYDIYGKGLSRGELDGRYQVYAYLRSRISTLDIMAVGPENQVEKERLYLFAPEAREFRTVSLFDSILFSVGHSYLVYRQSSFGRYVSQSLLLGARYWSPERGKKLGYYGEFFSTLYTYDSSPIDRSSNFLEVRAGGSYSMKVFKNPKARSKITFGLNNINLFSLGGGLGFSGLYGPNFGLKTEYYKSSRDSIATELHYTVYEFEDFFTERSIKLSLDWNRALKNMRKAQFGFSYSNHEFSEGLEEISSDLFSVYFSLSF